MVFEAYWSVSPNTQWSIIITGLAGLLLLCRWDHQMTPFTSDLPQRIPRRQDGFFMVSVQTCACWYKTLYLLNFPDDKVWVPCLGPLGKRSCAILSSSIFHPSRCQPPTIQLIFTSSMAWTTHCLPWLRAFIYFFVCFFVFEIIPSTRQQ